MEQSSNKKAAIAGIGYTIGNILIKGLSFITLPIFTRLMTTADYGIYTTYIAYESILTILVSLALYASLKNAKIDFPGKIDEYTTTLSIIPIVFGVIIILIIFPFRSYMGAILKLEPFLLLLMIVQACASSLLTLYNCRIGLDYSYKNFIGISIFNTVGNVLTSLLLILLLFKEEAYLGRILGTFIPISIIGAYVLIKFIKKAPPKKDIQYITYGLKYSLPLIPHGISQLILAQFGKIIIQNKIGNSAAGLYGFAYTIALIPQIMVQSIGMAWGPWFFEAYNNKKILEIKNRTTQCIALFSFVTVVLFCVSPEIVKMMADSSYWSSIRIIAPAILGVFFTFLYGFPVEIEYYYKKTNYIAIGTVISATINVFLCIFLVPEYGYESAVYVTLLTYVLYFIAHMVIAYFITQKQLPFEIKQMSLYIIAVCLTCCLIQLALDLWVVRYLVTVVWSVILYKKYRVIVDAYVLKVLKNKLGWIRI